MTFIYYLWHSGYEFHYSYKIFVAKMTKKCYDVTVNFKDYG